MDESVASPQNLESPEALLDALTEKPGEDTANGPVLLLGQTVGDYELIREIARGGMGVVYLAKQIKLNRLVALKMVLPSGTASEAEQKRFANEARAAGALDHKGIVPVYEVGTFGDRPYFSMAYVDGKSLAEILADGPMQPRRAAEIARDVAVAIAHAHDQQIIHRDLKPANILIDKNGCSKITDFGVCKSLASHSQITSHGELIGTPHYMPPEQAGTPDAVIGPASDVYSLGAVLYAMLTARPPFQAPSPIDVVAQVMTKEPVPPSRFVSGVPEDLETIAMKCLAKASSDRYPSAHRLADDLERFLKGEPILAKPPGLFKRFHHGVRRHVFLASVSGSFALTLVIFTVVLGFAFFQSQSRIVQLTELLKLERTGARRIVSVDSRQGLSEIEYDVRRLTDAASEFVVRDRQLATHLAVYAGRLSVKHDVAPPDKLRELLIEFASDVEPAKSHDADTMKTLYRLANSNLKRELTEFELAVFGLFDPSHQMEQPRDSANNDARE